MAGWWFLRGSIVSLSIVYNLYCMYLEKNSESMLVTEMLGDACTDEQQDQRALCKGSVDDA